MEAAFLLDANTVIAAVAGAILALLLVFAVFGRKQEERPTAPTEEAYKVEGTTPASEREDKPYVYGPEQCFEDCVEASKWLAPEASPSCASVCGIRR